MLRFIDFWIPKTLLEDAEDGRRARGLVICCFVTAPVWPLFALDYKGMGVPWSFYKELYLFGLALLFVPAVLKISKSLLTAGNFCGLIYFGTFAYTSFYDGGLHSQAMLNMPLVSMFVVFLVDNLSGVVWSGVIIIYIFFLLFLEKSGFEFHRMVSPEDAQKLLFKAILGLISVTAFITAYYEKIRSDLYSLAKGRLNELEEKNKTIVEQQQLMVQNSKMAALGEMAAGIAHEINNPLATIQITSSQLKEVVNDETFDRDFFKQGMGVIESTVVRIAQIIKGLRSFSRDASTDLFVRTKVASLIQETLGLCQQKFKSYGVKLNVSPFPEDLMMICQPVQLSQVLLNLLNNAFDAMEKSKDRWITIEVSELPRQIEIVVCDSGSGVPPQIRDKIFQPFFTTKEIGKGTGLGLSVSRGIIEKHSGQIFLDTKSPNTRFVLLFPKSLAS